MKEIKLTQGKVAMVDDADFEWLNQWRWHVTYQRGCWYARRNVFDSKKQIYTSIGMHQMILEVPFGMEVDHQNHNGIDNQRCNLRTATRGENQHNQNMQARKKTSKYKGVHFDKQYGLWRAHIKFEGRVIHIGRFDNEIQAALAYYNNSKAKELFGSFAYINKVA